MGWCSNPFKGFPLAVYFIIGNELCERFNYYGMRAILSIYLVVELGYSQDSATGIYHVFNFMAYAVPMLGAIAADSFFGKFFVILALSLVYATGSVVLAVGAIDATIAVTFTIVGLTLIAVGTGGIKPCVVSFGAQQFPDSPESKTKLSNYFATFYFAINLGSLISMNLTPTIRTEVSCFGKDSCYPLAFGLPAALMIFATVLFISGCFFYVMDRPRENVVFRLICCVSRAIGNSICHRDKNVKKEYYIDYADDKYDSEFRADVRRVFSILLIFLPVPVFWALFDQQGSRWTFQAINMDGEIANGSYIINPDQLQSLNPLMILILVPFCQLLLYPLCKKCHFLVTPLQRLSVGGMLAVLSFIVAAALELEVEKSYYLGILDGEAQLKIVNGLDCQLTIEVDATGRNYTKTLEKLEMWHLNDMSVSGTKDLNMILAVPNGCVGELTEYQSSGLTIKEKTANFYFITRNDENEFAVTKSKHFQDVGRSPDMRPKIGLMYFNRGPESKVLKLIGSNDVQVKIPMLSDRNESNSVDFLTVDPNTYDVAVGSKTYFAKRVRMGGVFMVLFNDNEPPRIEVILEPATCHMLWQIPQYLVMSLAEAMFSVAGLEFAYVEAPPAMRSLIQSFWLLTTSMGNVIVAIIASAKVFDRQFYEYLFFAGFMFLDMLVFILLSVWYKYVKKPEPQNETTT